MSMAEPRVVLRGQDAMAGRRRRMTHGGPMLRPRSRRRFIDIVGAFEQMVFRLALAPILFAGALAVRWFGRTARQKRRVERERTHILYNSIALQGSFGGFTTEQASHTTKGSYAAVTQAHDAVLLCKTLRSTMAIGDKPKKKSWWRS